VSWIKGIVFCPGSLLFWNKVKVFQGPAGLAEAHFEAV